MKQPIPIVLLLNVFIGGGLFGGCDRPDPFYEEISHQKTKSTFVYMVADNNLDYYAAENVKKIEDNFPLDAINDIYVYIDRNKHAKPSHPYLLRISRMDKSSNGPHSAIIAVYKEQNSSDPNVLKKILGEVLEHCSMNNSRLSNIILWSHGSGWLPKNALNNDNAISPQSFGEDNTNENNQEAMDEMDILDLAKVFERHHFDLLIMDACFMGSIEYAYELRHNFDHLILSPSEILATGFPYDQITSDLTSNDTDPIGIASKFCNYYSNQKNALQSATMTVVQTKHIAELAHYMKPIYHNYKIGRAESILAIPQYDRTLSHFFFDLKKFVDFNLNNKTDGCFNDLWNRVVLYYGHTDRMFSSLDLNDTNGLSVYIPNDYEKRAQLHEYYRDLSWAKDSNALALFD